MDLFQPITVVFSIILGLGIVTLLKSLVAMFRSRGRGNLHWMPLTWAFCIFIFQIQFWWAIIDLRTMVSVWSLGQFLLLLSVSLLLFLAAALILPETTLGKDQKLLDEFHRDGQWALAVMSLYAIVAGLVDSLFWETSPASVEMVLLGVEALLPILNLLTRRVWLETLSTLLYTITCVGSSLYLSPFSYS